MITREELNPNNYPLTGDLAKNFERLYIVCNAIRIAYAKPLIVNRGVSSPSDQQRINPSHPHDAHVMAAGVDFKDPPYQGFWDWCTDNLEFLIKLNVYLEDRAYTPSHVHLQIYAPASGKRIFIP